VVQAHSRCSSTRAKYLPIQSSYDGEPGQPLKKEHIVARECRQERDDRATAGYLRSSRSPSTSPSETDCRPLSLLDVVGQVALVSPMNSKLGSETSRASFTRTWTGLMWATSQSASHHHSPSPKHPSKRDSPNSKRDKKDSQCNWSKQQGRKGALSHQPAGPQPQHSTAHHNTLSPVDGEPEPRRTGGGGGGGAGICVSLPRLVGLMIGLTEWQRQPNLAYSGETGKKGGKNKLFATPLHSERPPRNAKSCLHGRTLRSVVRVCREHGTDTAQRHRNQFPLLCTTTWYRPDGDQILR
jgi:hypothetical protein